jgi:hypothetical protein
MRNGVRKNSITIEVATQIGTDEANDPIVTWGPWRSGVLAGVEARRGAELFDPETKQRYSEVYFRFRCALSDVSGINSTMRISFEGQMYDIRNILPDTQRHEECIIEASLQDGSS